MSTLTRQSNGASRRFEELTMEDARILIDRTTSHQCRAYARADDRDYTAMQACRCDRDAVDMEGHGISEKVATRIHHGFLAFRASV